MFLKRRHGTVTLPTGTGKTAIALEAMRVLQLKTAIIVPTTALLNDWVEKLKKCGVCPGVYYGEEKRLADITVFVINSAALHTKTVGLFSFIVFDEVHHLGSPEFCKLLNVAKVKPYALGMSAHLKRSDERERLIVKVLPVIYSMKVAAAMNKKFISSLKIYRAQAQMTGQERKLYDKYTETIRRAAIILHTVNPSELAKMSNNPLAKACLAAMVRRKMLLSNVKDKQVKVKQILKLCKKQRVLIFSESVKGIDAVYEYLRRNGVKCGIYHSQIDHQTRDLMLRQWKENVFQVLCAVRCLDEGIDVPECRIGVIVATGTTTKQLIQRIGRLVRKRSDGSRGLLFIVYCAGTVEVGYAQKIRWVIQNE